MDRIRFKCEDGLLHAYEVCHWRTVELMEHNRRIGAREAQADMSGDLEMLTGERPDGRALIVIDGGKV